MDNKEYRKMSDDQLLLAKKKMKSSKLFHAISIGFLAGILIFGFTAWVLDSDRKIGFIIPMLFPIFMIYKILKSPNKSKELEEVLKDRNLY